MTKQEYLISIRETLAKVKVYSCDIETVDLSKNTRITTIIFACRVDGKDQGWVLHIKEYPVELITRILKPIFDDKLKTIVFHNAKFDIPRLRRHGVLSKNRLADTMIMAWLHDEDRIRHGGHGLKNCAKKYFGHTMFSYEDAQSLFGDFTQYALEDAIYTLKLYYFFYEKLFSKSPKLEKWFWKYEMPITQVLIEIETRGSCLDPVSLKDVQTDILSKLDQLEKEIYTEVGHRFDIGSPKQCAVVLFRSGEESSKFFTEETSVLDTDLADRFSEIGKSGDYSTANNVLKAMSYEGIKLASLILKFRELNTRLNTFVRPSLKRCKVSNIIFPKFFQTTKSGRLRSRDPNYQNLPRRGGIRKSFIARPGYKIVKADLSQAELRLIAHLSNDPIMIDIYRNGGDIHQKTADACRITRQEAKAVNFLLIYRGSANRLQSELAKQGVAISKSEAHSYIKRYFDTYKKVREYHKNVENAIIARMDASEEAGIHDGVVSYVMTLAKRKRRFTKEDLSGEKRYGYITQGINTTVQGGVGDLVKMAMVDCQNEFKERGWLDPDHNVWDAYIHGQVHDEIFTECKVELAEEVAVVLTNCMENAGRKFRLRVPMPAEAEIRDNLAK